MDGGRGGQGVSPVGVRGRLVQAEDEQVQSLFGVRVGESARGTKARSYRPLRAWPLALTRSPWRIL